MKNIKIKNCDFPFNYYGKSRRKCILDKRKGKKWCATKKDSNNKIIKKGWCIPKKKSRKYKKKSRNKKTGVKPTEDSMLSSQAQFNRVFSNSNNTNNTNNKQLNLLLKNNKVPDFLESYWNPNNFNVLLSVLYLYKKHKSVLCKPIGYLFDRNYNTHPLVKSDFEITFEPSSDFDLFEDENRGLSDTEKKILSTYEIGFPKSHDLTGYRGRDVWKGGPFFESLLECKKQGKRFYVSILSMETATTFHDNILIFDLEKNTCERFEPYGSQYLTEGIEETLYNVFISSVSKLFDKKMKSILKLHKFKYISPIDYCPKESFQIYNNLENNRTNTNNTNNRDPAGFCSVWSLWWADLRLSNPDIPYDKLVTLSFDKIAKIGFRKFIRNYSIFLTTQIISLFNELKVTPENQQKMLNLKNRHLNFKKRHLASQIFNAFLEEYLSKIID
jgi:hypothetical protein